MTSLPHTSKSKFNIRELKESYEFLGHFPGFNRDNLQVELRDSHTLVIKGRIEREYSSEFPEDSITSVQREKKGKQIATTRVRTPPPEGSDHPDVLPRYLVAESSVVECHCAFFFPSPLDEDAAKARFVNGLLLITCPKWTGHKVKRLRIE
ncbi:hypothetical protein ACLMJK_007459 [Lecanora helva]